MNKNLTVVMALAAACAANITPAFAADTLLGKAYSQAFQATALGSGLAIGIPTASLRSLGKSIACVHASMTEALAGKTTDDAPAAVMTFLPSIPVGTVSGVLNGVNAGWDNAVNNYKDKPFSAESFSLDHLGE